MSQLLILETSATDFTIRLNRLLKTGFHVVPGSSYASHVQHDEIPKYKYVERTPYFFAVLSSDNYQMSISTKSSRAFHLAVNDKLKEGFTIILGTMLITTIETVYDTRLIEPVYSILIERN